MTGPDHRQTVAPEGAGVAVPAAPPPGAVPAWLRAPMADPADAAAPAQAADIAAPVQTGAKVGTDPAAAPDTVAPGTGSGIGDDAGPESDPIPGAGSAGQGGFAGLRASVVVLANPSAAPGQAPDGPPDVPVMPSGSPTAPLSPDGDPVGAVAPDPDAMLPDLTEPRQDPQDTAAPPSVPARDPPPVAAVAVPAVAARPRRRHRLALRGTLAVVFLLPLAFALIAAIGMIGQEVTAPSWLRQRIEAQAALALGGGSLRFGDITVTVGRDLHPVVRLREVVLRDAADAVLARVPMIEAQLSPRGLILRREVLPQTITLRGAELALRRNRDGTVAMAFATATEGSGRIAGSTPGLAALLQEFDVLFARRPLEALQQVRVEGLILNFDDARAGRSWTVDDGQFTLDLTDGASRLRGTLSVLSGRDYVTTLQFAYDSPGGSPAAQVAVTVLNAAAADIATQAPVLAWLSVLNAPISATLRAELDDNGDLSQFHAALKLGSGAVQPVAGAPPLRFDGVRANLAFDPAAGRITFSRLSVQSDWGAINGTGTAWLGDLVAGWPGTLVGQFALTDISVNPPGLYPAPITFAQAFADLRLRLDPFQLTIGQFTLTEATASPGDAAVIPVALALPSAFLTGRAQIEAAPEGWSVALDGAIPLLDQARAIELWPTVLNPGTRQWFVDNLTAGRVSNIHGGLRLVPGLAPRYAISHEFDGVTVTPMRRLPPITGAAGWGTYDNGAYALTLDQGVIAAPQGGGIDVAGSSLIIPDTNVPDPPATVRLQTDSTITAALALLDMPPLSLLTPTGLPVTLADGRAFVSGVIDLRLMDNLPREDLDYDVTAALTDLRSDVLVPGRVLAAAALDLTVNPDRIAISGAARVGRVPVQAQWDQALGPGVDGSSRVAGTVELSDRFIDEFRIGLPPGSVSDAGQADFVLDLARDGAATFRLESDLRGLALNLPPLGWAKGAGQAGRLEVTGRLGAAPGIDRLSLSAAGLEAEGAISLTAEGGLGRAIFGRVQLGGWLDAPVTLVGRGADRAPEVQINGGSVDLRRAAFGETGGQGGPMQVTLDRLQISDGIALTGFVGSFDADGGFSGSFSAGVNGAAQVTGTVVPQGNRAAVRIQSADAGAVLRAAGFLDNAQGGALDMTLLPAGAEGSYDGRLDIADLRVRDAPALASLLNAISVLGLLQQMAGQGLVFDRVEAEFRIDPDRISVLRSSAVGLGLGISLDGAFEFAGQVMDFQGVISPFFVLNGIGAILTRPGEGLIGFNFRLQGPMGTARVSVNPLSVLTPGMFRELFRRPPPEVQ